jgi:hypothetical protein
VPNSYLDTVTLHAAGLLRLSGWSLQRPTDLMDAIGLEVDGQPSQS